MPTPAPIHHFSFAQKVLSGGTILLVIMIAVNLARITHRNGQIRQFEIKHRLTAEKYEQAVSMGQTSRLVEAVSKELIGWEAAELSTSSLLKKISSALTEHLELTSMTLSFYPALTHQGASATDSMILTLSGDVSIDVKSTGSNWGYAFPKFLDKMNYNEEPPFSYEQYRPEDDDASQSSPSWRLSKALPSKILWATPIQTEF